MQLDDIKSPGALPSAIRLRSEAYRAISYVSIQSDLTLGRSESAAALLAFFKDCYDRTQAIITPAPTKKESKK